MKLNYHIDCLLPLANEVWGKVMFLHVSVILSRGEGGLHRGGVGQTPPDTTGYGLRGGQYASYWNAFLCLRNVLLCDSDIENLHERETWHVEADDERGGTTLLVSTDVCMCVVFEINQFDKV